MMLDHTGSAARFSMGQARGIVKDLFQPNLAIYWADFLLSSFVGGLCFVLLRRVFEPFSVPSVVAFVVCGLCYYRAVLFIHELVHVRDQRFRLFSVTWNLMCGIPFLMPTFMYYTHADHHMRKHFGTHDDGEYLPLGAQSPWHILVYLCQPFVLPILAIVRFLILAPICWVSPAARAFVQRRASSMVMDPSYIRPLPSRSTLRVMRLQEVAVLPVVRWGRHGDNRGARALAVSADSLWHLGFHPDAQCHPHVGCAPIHERWWRDDVSRPIARFNQLPEPTIHLGAVGTGGAAISRAAPCVPVDALPQPGNGAPPPDGGASGRFALSFDGEPRSDGLDRATVAQLAQGGQRGPFNPREAATTARHERRGANVHRSALAHGQVPTA